MKSLKKFYKIMETDSIDTIHQWVSNWDDIMKFMIVLVTSSKEAKKRCLSLFETPCEG
jgi:hypothetical protein